MQENQTQSLDVLLSRIDYVRSLARRLVRDGAEADDLVQDALVQAIDRPRPVSGNPVGWIGTVLRNLSRDRSRSGMRRQTHETAGAKTESQPGGLDNVLATERHRELAEVVLALEEPYRTTLSMRYFEDLPPREIAKRTGSEVETVKKRLSRGLAQLRQKLEARYGNSGAWAVALLPLTGFDVLKGLPTSTVAAGGMWSGRKLALASLALVSVGATGAALWPDGENNEGESRSASSQGLAPTSTQTMEAISGVESNQTAEDQSERTVSTGPSSPTPAANPNENTALAEPFGARIVNLQGKPISHTTVVWTPTSPHRLDGLELTSDANGWLSKTDPTPRQLLAGSWASADGTVGQISAGFNVDADRERTIVLVPMGPLAGTVTDPNGRVIDTASIALHFDLSLIPQFPLRLETQTQSHFRTEADAQGQFDLGLVPLDPTIQIRVRAPGYQERNFRVPSLGDASVKWTLRSKDSKPVLARIRGMVVDESGNNPKDLKVHYGQDEGLTDATGFFELPLTYLVSEPPTHLTVRSKDGRFAMAPSPDLEQAKGPGGSELVRLVIPKEMPSLQGVLKDAQGAPIPGAEIYFLDGTHRGNSSATYEKILGMFGEAKTDEQGRFTCKHLQPRPYHLRFLVKDRMWVIESGPLDPKSKQVVVQAAADSFHPKVEGRVVDFYDQPMVGASVSVAMPGLPFGNMGTYGRTRGLSTLTGAKGEFVLEQVGRHGVELEVIPRPQDSMRNQTIAYPLVDLDPSAPLELKTTPLCDVFVDLDTLVITQEDKVHISFQNGQGQDEILLGITPTQTKGTWSWPIHSSRKPPLLRVKQSCTQITLTKNGDFWHQRQIRLSPTERNRVSF